MHTSAWIVVLGVVCTAAAELPAQKAEPKKTAKFQWVNQLPKNLPAAVEHGTFVSQANQTSVGYCLLMPPGYALPENADKRYPVIYWLHGGRPGAETKNVRMASFFDAAMREETIPPMIYVFPNGGRMSHYDHGDSKGEQAFLELIRHVDQKYRTVADRSGRAIEGFSQGGRGTGRYIFRHPELFCSAAPLGGGQQHEKRISENAGAESESFTVSPEWNNTWELARRYAKRTDAPSVRLFIAVGDEDFNLEGNQEWTQHLDSLGIDHKFIVVPGVPHSVTKMYDKIGDRVMQFHVESFRKSGAIKENS